MKILSIFQAKLPKIFKCYIESTILRISAAFFKKFIVLIFTFRIVVLIS